MKTPKGAIAGAFLGLASVAPAQGDALYVTDPSAQAIYRVTPGREQAAPEIISATSSFDLDAFVMLNDSRALLSARDLLYEYDRNSKSLVEGTDFNDLGLPPFQVARGLDEDSSWLLSGGSDSIRLFQGARDTSTGMWSFVETLETEPIIDPLDSRKRALWTVTTRGTVVRGRTAAGFGGAGVWIWLADGTLVVERGSQYGKFVAATALTNGDALVYLDASQTGGCLNTFRVTPSGSTQLVTLPRPSVIPCPTTDEPVSFQLSENGSGGYLLFLDDAIYASDNPLFPTGETSLLFSVERPIDEPLMHAHLLSHGDVLTFSDLPGLQRLSAADGVVSSDLHFQRGAGPALTDVVAIDDGPEGKLYVVNKPLKRMQIMEVDIATGDRMLVLDLDDYDDYDPLLTGSRSWLSFHPFIEYLGDSDEEPNFLLFNSRYRKPTWTELGLTHVSREFPTLVDLRSTVFNPQGPILDHPLTITEEVEERLPADHLFENGVARVLFHERPWSPARYTDLATSSMPAQTLAPSMGVEVSRTEGTEYDEWEIEFPGASLEEPGIHIEIVLSPNLPDIEEYRYRFRLIAPDETVIPPGTGRYEGSPPAPFEFLIQDIRLMVSYYYTAGFSEPRFPIVEYDVPALTAQPGIWKLRDVGAFNNPALPLTSATIFPDFQSRAKLMADWGDEELLLYAPGNLRRVDEDTLLTNNETPIQYIPEIDFTLDETYLMSDLIGDPATDTAWLAAYESFRVYWTDVTTGESGLLLDGRPAEMAPLEVTHPRGPAQMVFAPATPLATIAESGWVFN